MVSRRVFVEAGLGLAACFAAWPARALCPPRAVERVAIVDGGIAGSAAFAAAARARGLPVFEFASDVAGVWMRELEPRLRVEPVEILGFTSPATAFCLELLARDFGASSFRPLDASTWLIATNPARRAPLAPPSRKTRSTHA